MAIAQIKNLQRRLGLLEQEAVEEVSRACGNDLWQTVGFDVVDSMEDADRRARANYYYGQLQVAIEHQLRVKKLQVVAKYVKKVIQLLETMLVRHGIMLVGATGTGKTTCATVLAKALGHLTSVVAIDDDTALMADHWDGATVPTTDIEGSCAAWQYRDRSD